MNPSKHSFIMGALLVSGATAFSASVLAADAVPKRVIVVTVTTGFRHSSIPTAERILQKLGQDSKAFTVVAIAQQPQTVVPKKPTPPKPLAADADANAKKRFEAETKRHEEAMRAWTPEVEANAKAARQQFEKEAAEALLPLAPAELEAKKIDGVIFANTTGDLPLPDKEGFIKWIENGHSLMAMHSASDTLHGFRPYIDLLGGEFATHGSQAKVVLDVVDPKHPSAKGIPAPWTIEKEEMYHIKSYDRSRVRDILASATVPMDGKPEQGQASHFPVSWVRTQGKGRVFYTSLGHREDVWDDDSSLPNRLNAPEVAQQYQKHILGGINWALGLAEGSGEPQAK